MADTVLLKLLNVRVLLLLTSKVIVLPQFPIFPMWLPPYSLASNFESRRRMLPSVVVPLPSFSVMFPSLYWMYASPFFSPSSLRKTPFPLTLGLLASFQYLPITLFIQTAKAMFTVGLIQAHSTKEGRRKHGREKHQNWKSIIHRLRKRNDKRDLS